MAKTTSTTKKKSEPKKATSTKAMSKKLSITLDEELFLELEAYLQELGLGKEEFVKKAIREKISHDKISAMIDIMIN